MDYHDHTICYIKQRLVDIKATRAVLEHKLNKTDAGSAEEDDLFEKLELLKVRQASLEQQKHEELEATNREANEAFGITCKAVAKMMEDGHDFKRIREQSEHSDCNDEIVRA